MADDRGLVGEAGAFLAFTPAELEIATAGRAVLEGLLPLERLHAAEGVDLGARARSELGALGWYALVAPEAAGGSGLSPVEFALFFREVGRQCAPLDLLAQSLGVLVLEPGSEPHHAASSGELAVALLVESADAVRLFGSPQAGLALRARKDEASVVDLRSVTLEPRPALDPGTSLSYVSGLPEPLAHGADETIWRWGQLGTAAMLVGLAEIALEMIVEYAKVRETFGRKIGSYQAVRHPCADMALRAEAARCQLWYAAASMKAGKADTSAHLDAAKHLANQAALINADVNIQLHGGIGLTDEHNAHLVLKRALLLSQLFGSKRSLLAGLLHSTLED